MRRIFDAFAYGGGPRDGCWWDETIDIAPRSALARDLRVDVAVVGAGFTGLSAARQLAAQGASVAVLEMHRIGWGASGRNGGFCCLGGGIADDAELDSIYGKADRLAFRQAEKQAVFHVEKCLDELRLDVDRHSGGETQLAHRPKDMTTLRRQVVEIRENYGVEPEIIEKTDLAERGMSGGPFHGGMTVPVGFGLNPRKYVAGLARAVEDAGAVLYEGTTVEAVVRSSDHWRLNCGNHVVDASDVLIATNGYSSEDVPAWLAGRYMPGQSTVLVTRPLTPDELSAQGWTSDQMSYDTRNLLHYFRLMPDRRFLFGMRGGLLTGAAAEARARRKTRADFERMFPAWRRVESLYSWSGMVSLARGKVPFVGPVPGQAGLWVSMCYHGNGVAMGSYAGHLIAQQILGGSAGEIPRVMRQPLRKFPFGRARRLVMPPLYASLMAQDY